MSDGLYEVDALAWGEQQASLLDRLAAGERLNEAIDWPHVIEEIRDVGLSELHACRSLLTRALIHLLKIHAWPESLATAHWSGEVAAFLSDARQRFSPSMRQRIDLSATYADALHQMRFNSDASGPPRPSAKECPFQLQELLAPLPEIGLLLEKLSVADADRVPSSRGVGRTG